MKRITEAVLSSTGNVAISYSAYCASELNCGHSPTVRCRRIKCTKWRCTARKWLEVTGTYDRAEELATEFARQRNLYYDKGARSIAAVESMKTLAFEIAEQLRRVLGSEPSRTPNATTQIVPWRAPDWYVQPVSGGLNLLGVAKGFGN